MNKGRAATRSANKSIDEPPRRELGRRSKFCPPRGLTLKGGSLARDDSQDWGAMTLAFQALVALLESAEGVSGSPGGSRPAGLRLTGTCDGRQQQVVKETREGIDRGKKAAMTRPLAMGRG
jgi:hypothetical protein